MKKVSGYSYLYTHKSYYYFRISIPRPLVGFFEKCEYKKSLKTRDFRLARTKCYGISLSALSFFEEINRLAMYLSEGRIKEIVQNHFEKRLLDASEEFFMDTLEAPNDPQSGFTPQDIKNQRQRSNEKLDHYAELKDSFTYDHEQENIAHELLEVNNIEKPSAYSQSNLRQLCLNLLRAHYEAERILNAYLNVDIKNGIIQDPYFEGCTNFFEEPDPGLYHQYHSKPYYGRTSSITLTNAFDLFYESLKDRALQEGKKSVSYKKYKGYFDDLFDIWDKEKQIAENLSYSELIFFKKQGAFNLGFHEKPKKLIDLSKISQNK